MHFIGIKGWLYNNRELNEICKIYGYGYGANTSMTTTYWYGFESGYRSGTITSGARSITLDDIGSISYNNSTTGYPKTYYGTASTTSGWSNGTSRIVYTQNYTLNANKYATDSTEYNLIFKNANASASVEYNIDSGQRAIDMGGLDYRWFQILKVKDDSITYKNLAYADEDSYSDYGDWSGGVANRTAGIRPLVFLNANVLTTGKNSSGAWVLN